MLEDNIEVIVANAVLEEQSYLQRNRLDSWHDWGGLWRYSFWYLSVADIQKASEGELIPILLENKIRLDDPPESLDELKTIVLWEKCAHMHKASIGLYSGRCGACYQHCGEGPLCQCNVCHYCSSECQRKHWKIHQTFCSYFCNRGVDPYRVWNGQKDDFFEKILAMFGSSKIFHREAPAKVMAELLKSFPPNIAQAHGPSELWKMASYVMDKCRETNVVDEQDKWLSVLEYIFSADWSHDERKLKLLLEPNVVAFAQHGGLSCLLRLTVDQRGSLETFTPILHRLSRCQDLFKADHQIEEHNSTEHNNDNPLLNLPPDVHRIIFHDMVLEKKPKGLLDSLAFARTCKSAARIVVTVLDTKARSQFVKEGVSRMDIMMYGQDGIPKDAPSERSPPMSDCEIQDVAHGGYHLVLERMQSDLATELGVESYYSMFFNAKRFFMDDFLGSPERVRKANHILGITRAMLGVFRNRQKTILARLKARYSLDLLHQSGPPSSVLPLEVNALRVCEHIHKLQKDWLEPYQEVADFIARPYPTV